MEKEENNTKEEQADGVKADNLINFDDFKKVELKVAQILEAEKIEKSKKLVKLQVDAGENDKRQIVAGIAKHYAPEDLVGRKIVIVANLAPAKLMGVESQGMLLAASDDSGLCLVNPGLGVSTGSRVS